jgi:hypothetical protein
MRLKTESAHAEAERLTREYLEYGGTISKISPNGRISVTCTNCGQRRAINARGAVLFGPARCWCGGVMNAT